jgi:HlyD family secretion protein
VNKRAFVLKDGKAKMVEVRSGISDATHVAIVSGLKHGDPAVIGPFRTLKKLHDGDSVTITKEERIVAPASSRPDRRPPAGIWPPGRRRNGRQDAGDTTERKTK